QRNQSAILIGRSYGSVAIQGSRGRRKDCRGRAQASAAGCPSALAALRLITSSNLVGCSTGNSARVAPLRTRPAYTPTCRGRLGKTSLCRQNSAGSPANLCDLSKG